MASVDETIADARSAVVAPSLGLFVGVIAALTIVRLIGQHFSVVDINTDEAQYWEWSRTLAFGYFSKPPLIAWLNWTSDAACGSSIECIRAPAPLFYAGTSLLVYGAAAILYSRTVAFWAGLALALAPAVSFFVADHVDRRTAALLLGAGAFRLRQALARWRLGMGTDTGRRHRAGPARQICHGLFRDRHLRRGAGRSRRPRAAFRNPRLWAGIAGGIVLFPLNVIWNVSNGLETASATADYVTPHGHSIHFDEALDFLVSQFAVLWPVTFGTLLACTACFGARAMRSIDRAMVLFAIPPVVIVFATGLYSGNAYANWAATGVVAAVVVSAVALVRGGWWRLIFGAAALGLITQAVLLFSDPFADRISFPILGKNADIYRATMGWHGLADEVAALAVRGSAAAIAVDGRDEVSTLTYYRRNDPQPVLVWPSDGAPANQFEVNQALRRGTPEPILFVSGCDSPARLLDVYNKVVDLGGFVVPTGRTTQRIYHAYLLSAARGVIPPLGDCT